MKKITAIFTLVLCICGCGSPTDFEANGFKVKFPCNYQKIETKNGYYENSDLYGCESLNYQVAVYEGSFEETKEHLESRAREIEKDDKSSSVKTSVNKTDISEKEINSYKSLVWTHRTVKENDELEKLAKQVFVFKDGKTIDFGGSVEKNKNQSAEEFNKSMQEFENFFNSVQSAK